MSTATPQLAKALRDLTSAYYQGGPTGDAAYERAIAALATYSEDLPTLTPLWRRLTDIGDLADLPISCQFAVIFRTIAALLHSEWSGPEVAAWLVLEAKRAENNE